MRILQITNLGTEFALQVDNVKLHDRFYLLESCKNIVSQLQFLLENEVTIQPGFKATNDLMILVGKKVVSYTDIAEALLELWHDKKYPTAFVGKLWEICQKEKFDNSFVIQLKIPVHLEQFCQIIHHLYRNEERLYPKSKGKQGGNYLISFLWDVLEAKEITDEILKQYRLVR